MRRWLIGVAAFALAGNASAEPLFGMIGQILAKDGKRAELAQILLEGTGAMPGCLSYVIAEDPKDPNALWVTEVWDSKASHDASLKLPAVEAAVTRGRPLILGFGSSVVTTPIGGAGLQRRR